MLSTHMKEIQICRVYAPPKVKHGTWVLVDRFWPRGLKKETLDFDAWLKDITPSNALRQWFHENSNERWQEFSHRYIEELRNKGSLIQQILDMAKPLTLFYAAKDETHNHAYILKEVLLSWPHAPNVDSWMQG